MPKITVYHRRFLPFEDAPIFPTVERTTDDFIGGKFEAVAEIADAKLNEVFRLTNHIDASWTENEGVEALIERPRSTSVGDVIFVMGDGHYLVEGSGFAAFDPPPFNSNTPEAALRRKSKLLALRAATLDAADLVPIPLSPMRFKRCGECGAPEHGGASASGHSTSCSKYDHRLHAETSSN